MHLRQKEMKLLPMRTSCSVVTHSEDPGLIHSLSHLTALPLSSSALGPKCLKCKFKERRQPQHPDTDIRLAEGICESMIWPCCDWPQGNFAAWRAIWSCLPLWPNLYPPAVKNSLYLGLAWNEGKTLPKDWELSAAGGQRPQWGHLLNPVHGGVCKLLEQLAASAHEHRFICGEIRLASLSRQFRRTHLVVVLSSR